MPSIAGSLDLDTVMRTLALQRPVFHSEADFQFSFAQAVQAMDPTIQCRLELPVANSKSGRTEYLDLLCLGPAGRTPVEFKYFTRPWSGIVRDEAFRLRGHAATDLLRLHFVNDLVRLENSVDGLPGIAVLLTNEPALWSGRAGTTRDRDFHLHQGRELQGTLLWAEGTYEPNARALRGSYRLDWQDYSKLDDSRGGRHRYLGVEVS